MSRKVIVLTDEQREVLEKLWFIYGNRGKKHSHAGHRFIQCLLEEGTDHRKFFRPSRELTKLVDGIIMGRKSEEEFKL